jgi:hypothetical protein
VNVTPDEVEKGLVAAGIPQFAARSVRELDEEASYGYQAIVTPTVKDLTGRVPDFGRGLSPGDSARIGRLTRPFRGPRLLQARSLTVPISPSVVSEATAEEELASFESVAVAFDTTLGLHDTNPASFLDLRPRSNAILHFQ